MKSKFSLIPLIGFLLILSCKKENSISSTVVEDPTIFQDEYGRQLIFHGLNTTGSAKADPERLPWILESDVQREADSFGFSVARFLIFWDAIEPQQGVFDDTYLDKVEQRINWYTAHGMHVFLDMHQDLYSSAFGGDGAPAWAIHANGNPVNSTNNYGNLWFLKSLDPAVVACFVNFWEYTQYKELQDHYILMWKKVAERFKNNPTVIGYDLMNEPYAGDLVKNLNGDFEQGWLTNFYNRIIPAIRSVDDQKYIFFEPTSLGVNNGLGSALHKINDTRSVRRMCYAPHCYPLFIEAAPGPYDASAQMQMKSWEIQRSAEMRKQQCPMVIGETGISPSLPGYDQFLNELFGYADSTQSGWTYWSNDFSDWGPLNADRTERPTLQYMIRTYPIAVAGRIKKFSYDPATRFFKLTFFTSAAITKPTEIFIPGRYYPNGWNLTVAGTTNYTQYFNEAKQTLEFSCNENLSEVTIEISAK
jgi:endoglycosylceramidase